MDPAQIRARFDAKWTPEPNSGCYIWTAGLSRKGYGRVGFRGSNQQAQRVAWILEFGDIQPGLWVLHKCDVRCCVNPAHLFLGTNADNVADMIKKGRRVQGRTFFGWNNSMAVLTEEDVLAIRSNTNLTHEDLGLKYGVGTGTIGRVVRMERYLHG